MADVHLPPEPSATTQEIEKQDPPKERPEQGAKVDAMTAARNRGAFFKKS